MNVEGEVVTEAQIDAGLAAMSKDGFTVKDIETAMVAAGCSEAAAYRGNQECRAADRLLQRERRAGRIKFVRGEGWVRMKGAVK